MKARYFKRETVVFKFKYEVLPQYPEANDAQKELLWVVHLLSLLDIKKISKYQSKTWKYPKKELT